MLRPVLRPILRPILRPVLGTGRFSLTPDPIGYWTNTAFDETASVAVDDSVYNYDLELYSGRAYALDGLVAYALLPDIGVAVKSFTITVRSSTDTTVYATDDATQLEDASTTITANNAWQEVTITFTNAITGAIRLGTDGTSFFAGQICDVKFKNASGTVVDKALLSDHQDATAGGLDGLSLITQNGFVGQYVGGAAVKSLGAPVPQIAGMDWQEYSGFRNNTYVNFSSVPAMTGSGIVEMSVLLDLTQPEDAIMLLTSALNTTWLFGLHRTATDTDISTNSGSPTITVDGVAVTTRQELWNATVDGNPHTLRAEGVDFSTWPAFDLNNLVITVIPLRAVGLIYNLKIDVTGDGNWDHWYFGYGPEPWKDQRGSNNGTIASEADKQLVPEHFSNFYDALGNDFAVHRPLETTINFTPDGQGADEVWPAEHNPTRTTILWYFYDGRDDLTVGYDPAFGVVSGAILNASMPSPTIYIDGVQTSTLNIGWNHVALTTETDYSVGAIISGGRIAEFRFFDKTLSASEILSDYNQSKNTYITYPLGTLFLNGEPLTLNGEILTLADY